MVLADHDKSISSVSPEAAAEMAQYGITRIPADYYRLGEFRYINLKDAVAQAKRQKGSE